MPDTVRYYNPEDKKFVDYPWDAELGKPTQPLIDPNCDYARNIWHEGSPHTDCQAPIFYDQPKEEAKKLSEAATILHDAAALIDGARNDEHGDRHENFDTIAQMWSAWLGIKLSPASVAWMMVLVKVARAANGEKNKDNSTDAAGYASLAWELTDAGC